MSQCEICKYSGIYWCPALALKDENTGLQFHIKTLGAGDISENRFSRF